MFNELKAELKELKLKRRDLLAQLWESEDEETDEKLHNELDALVKRRVEIQNEMAKMDED